MKTKNIFSALILLITSTGVNAQETWVGSLTGTNQWGNTGCYCSGEFEESYSFSISSPNKLYDKLKCNADYQGTATYSGTESVSIQNGFQNLCELVDANVNITDSIVVNAGIGFIQLTSLSSNPLIPALPSLPISGNQQDDPIYVLVLHVNAFSANSVSGTWDAPGDHTCSSPQGTFTISKVNSLTADGIKVQNEIANNYAFQSPKILWSGNTNQTAAPIKICADGSKATKIIFTNNNSGVDLSDVHFKIASDPTVNYPNFSGFCEESTSGNKKTATFNHPTYLPYSYTPYRDDTILIVNDNNLCATYKIPVRIYPAPIVLVHGLWSSASSFQKMVQNIKADLLLPNALILPVNYKATNDASFYDNRYVVPDNITALLTSARNNNFSAGKVDVIGHSMGGLLARLYLQSSAYIQKKDIHKLITLNTPHSGSQGANILLNPSSATSAVARIVAEPAIKLFNQSTSSSIYNGAVEDLKINSYAMDYLDSYSLNNSVVPTHSIITKSQLGDDNLFHLIYAAAGSLNLMSATSFRNYLFYNYQNDMVVSSSSQSGGLPLAATSTFYNQSHMGSPDNTDIIDEVIGALCINSNNASYFCQNGFTPVDQQSHYRVNEDTSSLQLLPGSVLINYPTQNLSFNPGDIIPVNINSSNGITKIMLQSINLESNSGILDSSMSNGILNYKVPANAFGNLKFIAFGYDSDKMIGFDTVTIHINQTASLDSIALFGDTIYVQKNKTASVSVTSFFNNGYNYDVSMLPNVQYQVSNASYAKYNGQNLIKGLKVGTTLLTVTYQNMTKNIPVVIIPEDTSSVNFVSSVNDDQNSGNNSTPSEIKNVTVFPNPFNSATTIQYEISENENVSIKVFDIFGHLVKNLFNANQTAGEHKINFDGNNLSEGIYIVEIRAANKISNRKLLHIK